MPTIHGVTSATPVGVQDAEQVAKVMSALATASRVRILAHLRLGPCSVGDLASTVEMAQPAVSQHLRILRDLGLVTGSRRGRMTVYSLYDDHVRSLLDEALRHVAHVRAGDSAARPSTVRSIEQ